MNSLIFGSRKSQCLSLLQDPLVEFERTESAKLQQEIRQARAARQTYEKKIARLRDQAAKSDEQEEMKSLLAEINEIEENMPLLPVTPRLFTEDFTVEQLGTMLANQQERMAIMSDEAGIFAVLAGRYSKDGRSANLDLVLKAHNGSSVRVDRGSREPVILDHPLLQIIVTPQPGVAQKLISNAEFNDRGLNARFLSFMPKPNLGYWKLQSKPIPLAVQQLYAENINKLLNVSPALRGDREIPHTLTLSNEAYKVWKDFQRRIETTLRPGGELHMISGVGGKLPGQAARLAGILHVADYVSDPTGNLEISGNAMMRGVLLAEVAKEHICRIYSQMSLGGELTIAKRLWEEIVKIGATGFTAREAWLPTRGIYPKMKMVEPGFQMLVDRGWIIAADPEEKPGRPERRFLVNPNVPNYAHFAHGA